MIIEIRVKNCLSFKEEARFSLAADNWLHKTSENLPDNVFTFKNKYESFDLVKSAVLYWPNAWGKSNFFKIAQFIRLFIILSFREDFTWFLEPFLLSTVTKNKPSEFFVMFVVNKCRYEYSFALKNEIVVKESLYSYEKGRKKMLFSRVNQKVTIWLGFDAQAKEVKDNSLLRNNALFLSTVAQINWDISNKIKSYFMRKINIPYSSSLQETIDYIKEWWDNHQKIVNFLKEADLWIEDFFFEEALENANWGKVSSRSNWHRSPKITTMHNILNETWAIEGVVNFNFYQESAWTRQFFDIAWVISQALDQWQTLFVDEFNTRLHTHLTRYIVEMFNCPKRNPHNAQLIFITHDTNLLDLDLFRRDQVWFAEKNKEQSTEVYSLTDFGERINSAIEKKYLMWLFGAVPFISTEK